MTCVPPWGITAFFRTCRENAHRTPNWTNRRTWGVGASQDARRQTPSQLNGRTRCAVGKCLFSNNRTHTSPTHVGRFVVDEIHVDGLGRRKFLQLKDAVFRNASLGDSWHGQSVHTTRSRARRFTPSRERERAPAHAQCVCPGSGRARVRAYGAPWCRTIRQEGSARRTVVSQSGIGKRLVLVAPADSDLCHGTTICPKSRLGVYKDGT